MIYFFIFAFVFLANIFPQAERYTKGAENGYSWIRMEEPGQFYSTSKETYLGSILERFRLTGERYPEIESLSCKADIEKLYREGKSEEISLEGIVFEIDKFYLLNENMIIPIIFSYCYSIKKLAGAGKEELNNYREKVLLFCND